MRIKAALLDIFQTESPEDLNFSDQFKVKMILARAAAKAEMNTLTLDTSATLQKDQTNSEMKNEL